MRASIILALLLALPCAAGEICVDAGSDYLPCPPGDVGFLFPSTGFDTDGDPCTVESDGWLRVLISSSNTDPHVNSGPTDGFRLYLWMVPNFVRAGGGYGFGSVSLQFHDTLGIGNYVPYSDQVWNPSELLLGFGSCLPGEAPPSLLGEFWVPPTPVEETSWGEVKSTYRD